MSLPEEVRITETDTLDEQFDKLDAQQDLILALAEKIANQTK